MYVCLWSPDWSTGEGSAADAAGASGPERDRASADFVGNASVGSYEADSPREPAATPFPLTADLAALAPRIRVEPDIVWADGRGLDAEALAGRLLNRLAELGVRRGRAGVAAVPVVAELAARWGAGRERDPDGAVPFLVKDRTGWGWRRPAAPDPAAPKGEGGRGKGGRGDPPSPSSPPPSGGGASEGAGAVVVAEGEERAWLGGLPVVALGPDERVRVLLDGVGVKTAGDLSALAREAVEVRFGAGAVALWRLARGDDRRRLFRRVRPDRPCGSIDFVDYVLTDPARLLFTANSLLTPLCEGLVSRGEHARSLRLTMPLADGSEWERVIRPARPTASRDTWLRLIRGLLDRLTVPDAVTGMLLEVGATEPAAVRQGDLFDRGFATAAAVEAAVARLVERQRDIIVRPEADGHALVERRGRWRPAAVAEVQPGASPATTGLRLHLLSEPRRILAETVRRRDHDAPLRFRDRSGWTEIVTAAGPDRVSGGQWESEPFAREYHRCVTGEGAVVWLYRDGREGDWYLHGWWD